MKREPAWTDRYVAHRPALTATRRINSWRAPTETEDADMRALADEGWSAEEIAEHTGRKLSTVTAALDRCLTAPSGELNFDED